MIEFLFSIPLLIAVPSVLAYHYTNRKKQWNPLAWAVSLAIVTTAFLAPLAMGVWLPDFTGKPQILGRTNSADGQTFEVIQFWNRVDFYTTELVVTPAVGPPRRIAIDGDAAKGWNATISLNETQKTASIRVDGTNYSVISFP
ncbi:MAG: hypothetical protein QM680_00090 [Luteolibacter sp.]